MEKIVRVLKKHPAITLLVVSHLYVACFYSQVRRYYSLYCDDNRSKSKQGHSEPGDQVLKPSKTASRRLMIDEGSCKRERLDAYGHGRSIEWDWKHFPRISPYFTAYKWFSSTMMVYFLIKNSAPGVLIYLINCIRHLLHLDDDRRDKMPDECLLLGRFSIDSSASLSDVSAALFSLYHLLWRFTAAFGLYQDRFALFMMQTDQDIERFLKFCKRRPPGSSYPSLKPYDREAHSSWPMMKSTSLETRAERKIRPELLPYIERDFADSSRSSLEQSNLPYLSQQAGGLCGFERLMLDVMFYKVVWNRHVTYRLRLNRTLEAHEELKVRLIYNLIGCLAYFLILCPPITLYVAHSLIFDQGYCRRYPGCNRELDQLNADGSLGQWSWTITTHRVLALAGDSVENFILWMDSGWALMYNTAYSSILSQDLLLCCKRLQAKIEIYLHRAKLDHHLASSRFHAYSHVIGDRAVSSYFDIYPHNPCTSSRMEGQRYEGRKVKSSAEIELYSKKFANSNSDREMFELQTEVRDFFKQIESVDQYYSTFLTAYLIIWFSARCLLSYYSLKVTKSDVPIVVHLLQVFNFCNLTYCSWNAFKLYGGCTRICRLLCSLMAYDRSKCKMGFKKILDFYCQHKRFGFTLFHEHPYTPTIYLSIVGWSLSCFFIISSLFRIN